MQNEHNPLRLVLFGIQGSGKGTAGKRLSKIYNIPHISTGDILRSNFYDISDIEIKKMLNEAKDYGKAGRLVPDNLIMPIVEYVLNNGKYLEGFILDGYPRTLTQAIGFIENTSITAAINFKLSDNEAEKRITGRITCSNPICNKEYNLNISSWAPKKQGLCDLCKSNLKQRADDLDISAVKERIKLFHEKTKPIISLFPNQIHVEAESGVKKPIEIIVRELERPVDINRYYQTIDTL